MVPGNVVAATTGAPIAYPLPTLAAVTRPSILCMRVCGFRVDGKPNLTYATIA